MVISLLIIWGSVRLIRVDECVAGRHAGTYQPGGVEDAIPATSELATCMISTFWTITSGRDALSAHVIHGHSTSQPDLLKELRAKLHERFGVDHLTIQMETADFEDETFHFCNNGTACFKSEAS